MLHMSEVRKEGNHINIHSVVKLTGEISSLHRMFVEITVISRNKKFAHVLLKGLCLQIVYEKFFLSNK